MKEFLNVGYACAGSSGTGSCQGTCHRLKITSDRSIFRGVPMLWVIEMFLGAYPSLAAKVLQKPREIAVRWKACGEEGRVMN